MFILGMVLVSFSLWAQTGSEINQLSDAELGRKFISSVRDVQIEQTLSQTAEFKTCMDTESNKFKSTATEDERLTAAENASKCLKDKIAGKSKEEIERLEKSLNLSGYNLVKSKSVENITKYLTNKMYKIMSGVDLEEKNKAELIKSMKFSNKKLLEQRDFIILYQNQLSKNALLEITTFCYEKFRKTQNPLVGTDFSSHWQNQYNGDFNDQGLPAYSTPGSDNQQAIYRNFLTSVGGNSQNLTTDLNNFFNTCTDAIKTLCATFESNNRQTSNISAAVSNALGPPSLGGNACLTKAKLQSFRKAIAESESIKNQFDSDFAGGVSISSSGEIKIFKAGATKETTFDSLTTSSSIDFLNGNVDENLTKKQKECRETPDVADCDNFLVEDDSYEKAQFDTDVAMNMKKELAKAKIRELKANSQDLETYLKDNGFGDLLKDYNEHKNEPGYNLEEKIGDIFEARKNATLEALRASVGSRQLSTGANPVDKERVIGANAAESANERTRLAQVVFFNNIVTSSLTLRDQNNVSLGRNTNATSRELNTLRTDVNVNEDLFSGITQNERDPASSNGNQSGRESITGLSFLNDILGLEENAPASAEN